MLIIFALAYGIYRFNSRTPVPTSAGPPGLTIYHDPTNGWTLQFPSHWHIQGVNDIHRGGGPYTSQSHGVLISNLDRRFSKEPVGPNSWSPFFDMRGLPATLIAVQVAETYGGGFTVTPCTDTPTPLSLRQATRTPSTTGAGGTMQLHLSMGFKARGSALYRINAWIGSKASKADLARLDRIVGSISFADVPTFVPEPGTTCNDEF